MRIHWKNGIIGLATGGVLAGALAGTLVLHRMPAGPSRATPSPQVRTVAKILDLPPPGAWIDDLGGEVPRPPNVGDLTPGCRASDFTLTVRPDRQSYPSGQIVLLVFDARFKGSATCRVGGVCLPDVTVRDSNGGVVWHWSGEVGGGICGGVHAALLSRASQHIRVPAAWRQDDCGRFCNDRSRADAAPAGQYTATGSWPPFGTSPPSQSFTLD